MTNNANPVVNLPNITTSTIVGINTLLPSLNIPRSILASDEAIEYSWANLPRQLKNIPLEYRNELIARMCIAVSVGLFDSAINYVWNAAILSLREKVKSFGLNVVAQILQKDFEEKHLLDLQDSELLDICFQLNILDEQAYFFLSQARSTRNNYSAAHPSVGMIDETELLAFSNRCIQYALANPTQHTGVVLKEFIDTLKCGAYSELQKAHWISSLSQTYDAQRTILVKMMHGMYCDANSSETTRQNIINLCISVKEQFTSQLKSDLITNHNSYKAKGDEDKHKASLKFFELLSLLGLLDSSELHSLFHRAIERLYQVHGATNNFYNEPPFAERVYEITQQHSVPSTIQELYVHHIVCCYIGNGYGVSNAAIPFYENMIRNFSPLEISFLFKLAQTPNVILGYRIENVPSCKRRFGYVLDLINLDSVPDSVKPIFSKFKSQY
ncbi:MULTISPECIES: hypothetical protein [unclassified Acinetobacter]|uniref:hypothetical protein n=1 Tax=unclassified Acinetobacter TaxID=196816 RepID=UPI00287E244A|nr:MULTISPECIES: hypothetical protein [unclassified Acinetobacter]MDS7957160.1 hypothetical protein [Acinetobacter sp. V104_13]MDS7983486.1 hypothetical protein [Acinetobacter sp. V104_3]